MRSLSLNRSKRNPKIHINKQRGAVVITEEMEHERGIHRLIYEKAETIPDPKKQACFTYLAFVALADPKIQVIDFAAIRAKAEKLCDDDDAELARLLADDGTAQAPISEEEPDANCGSAKLTPHAPRGPPGGHITEDCGRAAS
jgi:hypothetical protein